MPATNDDEVVSGLLKGIGRDLSAIRQLLELQSREIAAKELEQVATTVSRRKMWARMDGSTSTESIAKGIGVTRRAVQYFVEELTRAKLVSQERPGYPRRVLDIIPGEWELTQTQAEEQESEVHGDERAEGSTGS